MQQKIDRKFEKLFRLEWSKPLQEIVDEVCLILFCLNNPSMIFFPSRKNFDMEIRCSFDKTSVNLAETIPKVSTSPKYRHNRDSARKTNLFLWVFT